MPLASADVRASVHACKGEQRVRSAIVKQIFSAVQEHCPPENHSPFATRYSPFAVVARSLAIRRRFGSAGASPSHFSSSLVPRFSFRSMRRALSVVAGIDLVSRSAYKQTALLAKRSSCPVMPPAFLCLYLRAKLR